MKLEVALNCGPKGLQLASRPLLRVRTVAYKIIREEGLLFSIIYIH